jgi:ubiquinone/menaquinone biosynthesis C-methylase UbiE
MSLREAWNAEAERWVAWARHESDSYWRFHRDSFLELLPPACATLDVGCGEGRLPRELRSRGYSVVGVDGSEALLAHARAADPGGEYRVADAAALPFPDGCVELVTAFMVLHDVDDVPSAVREAARVLKPGGRLCLAIVHPMASAGRFEEPAPDAPFVVRSSYFEARRYADTLERGGRRITFHSEHRPIGFYVEAIAGAGLLVERLREIPDLSDAPGTRWQRVPLFLQLRAIKPRGPRLGAPG